MKLSPTDFYELTIREAELIVKAHTQQQKVLLDNYSMVVYSAVGQALGGQKWEAIFTTEETETAEPIKTEYTKEEKEQELSALRELFNS